MNTSEKHAVVLGGSLAGLLAARVLADHFGHVTLIERDVYTDNCETRPSEFKVLAFTRPLLDLHLRRRLSQNPRVEILDNTDVLRLIPGASKNQVAGVLICPRSSEADRRVAKELRADLVVDATGRASRAPRWLSELGFKAPEETIVDAHLGYASRLYHIPETFNGDWKCAYVQSAPPERKRGAILFSVEDNRWLVTLTGGGGDHPPSDEAGFLEFARSLPVSTIHSRRTQYQCVVC